METTLYYDLKSVPQRVYLVDEFVPTTLKKVSPGGIMGLRYLNVSEIAGSEFYPRNDYTTQQFAALLSGRSFQ